MDLVAIVPRAAYSIFTLYMLLILVRWFGPYLELDFYDTRLRWIAQLVDPVLRAIRKLLPPLGPIDLAPLVALLAIWFVRQTTVVALGAGI